MIYDEGFVDFNENVIYKMLKAKYRGVRNIDIRIQALHALRELELLGRNATKLSNFYFDKEMRELFFYYNTDLVISRNQDLNILTNEIWSRYEKIEIALYASVTNCLDDKETA